MNRPRVISLYKTGLSCRDIGTLLEVNDETIRKVLIACNVKRRPKSYKKPAKTPSWNEYFQSRTKRHGDCIIWTGFKDKSGYGRVLARFAPRIFFVHRLSWFLKHGDFDLNLRVLHSCDVRDCVNPKHLWLGTQIDNIRDMCAKGRQRGIVRRGECSPVAKLSNSDIRKMRAARKAHGTAYHKLAKRFSVSTMTAYRAITGQSWSHL